MRIKKYLVSLIPIFLLILILISLFYLLESNKDKKVFSQFLSNTNKERYESISNTKRLDISKYITSKNINESLFSDSELDKLTNYTMSKPRNILTYKEAASDIEEAFKLLKYVYGPYEYFGGDEIFLPKKKEILEELKNQNNINYEDIEQLLIENLSFINDGHFGIDGININSYNNKNLVYAYNDDYIFKKDSSGYYVDINKNQLYASSINGQNVEKYMKTTITTDGELAYSIGTLINSSGDNLVTTLSLIDGQTKETINKTISLERDFKKSSSAKRAAAKTIIDGIPIWKITKMLPLTASDKSLSQFADDGKNLKNSKVLIIDLRGNTGGSESYMNSWLKNYMGQEVQITESVGFKISKPQLWASKKYFEKLNYNENDYLNNVGNLLSQKKYGYWDSYTFEGKWYKNKNLIFVLMDNDTASASEGFISYLRNIENVVFVGTNSRGCVLTPNICYYTLPSSRVSLGLGTGIELKNTEANIEGRGFEPDIWINSSDALDRVIKLCKNYRL